MKKIKTVLLATLGFLVISTAQAADKVVASVNGIPVLESQIAKQKDRKAAINRIIDEILVQQEIKNSGIKIEEAQLNHVIEDIAAQNGLTYGQLLDAIEYQGISYATYRKQIAQQMLINKLRNQIISQSVNVSPEQVNTLGQQLFEQAKSQGKDKKFIAKEYEIRHILLKVNPILTDAKAKAQLDQIRSDITAGKTSFADAALKYSKDYLSGANGGNLGFAFLDIYSPQFRNAVLATKKGTISAPFKTEFGWHIAEVTGTRDSDRSADLYRQQAYETLMNDKLKDLEQDWIKVLRDNADIRYIN